MQVTPRIKLLTLISSLKADVQPENLIVERLS